MKGSVGLFKMLGSVTGARVCKEQKKKHKRSRINFSKLCFKETKKNQVVL